MRRVPAIHRHQEAVLGEILTVVQPGHATADQEPGDDFSDCERFSLVAWDHVS